jgi:glycosyltransferase involved in cell wall biosynthesis
MQEDRQILLAVTTRMGWKIYGERLNREATKHWEDRVSYVPFTPWEWARRIYWQTGYSDNTPAHAKMFDPFTIMACQAACTPSFWKDYSAAIIATQGVAAGFMCCRPQIPVFLVVDATRQLYRDEFGAKHISNEAIEREACLFRKCAHVFALSQWAAQSIVACSGLPREKLTVLPPASFDMTRTLKPKDGEYCLSEKLKVLFVGRDFKRKGGPRLLGWQKTFLSQFVDLYIVTDTHNFECNIPSTTWLGPVPNDALTLEIMPRMDLLLHPTEKDCSSLVVAEAAMCGLPAVVSAMGGIPDLVDNGTTGIIVEPYDASHFTDAVLYFHKNRDALKQFSLNAKQKADREFRAPAIYDKIITTVKKNIGIL